MFDKFALSMTPRVKRRQMDLPFPRGRGGARKGSGRRGRPGTLGRVPHRRRAALASRFPVQITSRLISGLPLLREPAAKAIVMKAFAAGCERNGFRLCESSIQEDHLHLIVEAKDRRSLIEGLRGLFVRVARALNNARKHGTIGTRTPLDRCSSGPWFRGWQENVWVRGLRAVLRPLADARTWLLCIGWKKFHPLISVHEVPGAR